MKCCDEWALQCVLKQPYHMAKQTESKEVVALHAHIRKGGCRQPS